MLMDMLTHGMEAVPECGVRQEAEGIGVEEQTPTGTGGMPGEVFVRYS